MKRQDDAWDAGWEGHERAQRRRLAALPLTDKLRWLEEADELVRHLRRTRPSTNRPDADGAPHGPADQPRTKD